MNTERELFDSYCRGEESAFNIINQRLHRFIRSNRSYVSSMMHSIDLDEIVAMAHSSLYQNQGRRDYFHTLNTMLNIIASDQLNIYLKRKISLDKNQNLENWHNLLPSKDNPAVREFWSNFLHLLNHLELEEKSMRIDDYDISTDEFWKGFDNVLKSLQKPLSDTERELYYRKTRADTLETGETAIQIGQGLGLSDMEALKAWRKARKHYRGKLGGFLD
jgi:hypothetical protein